MNEDFMFEPDENELNENDILFTDMVVQLMSSWFTGNTRIINAVCEGVAEDMGENPGAMPGLLFGCILHMSTMLNEIAKNKGISLDEAWSEYLEDYNLVFRERIVNIPLMHPEIAKRVSEIIE